MDLGRGKRPRGRETDAWAVAHGLTLTPANRSVVVRYLRTARSLRTIGAISGIVLGASVTAARGEVTGATLLSVWTFGGYLVGALYAELVLGRRAGAERAASLVPRQVGDYLTRTLVVAQRSLPVLCGAVAALVLAADDPPVGAVVDSPATVAVLAAAAGATLVMVVIEALERFIVRRPQPAMAPDLLAADDAIRSQAVHSIAGSGVAMQCLLASGLGFSLAEVRFDELVTSLGNVIGTGGLLAAVIACWFYGHRAFHVRRARGGAPIGASRP